MMAEEEEEGVNLNNLLICAKIYTVQNIYCKF